ncbi:hypothetical protein OIU79_000709, partial [Salix purpurea]
MHRRHSDLVSKLRKLPHNRFLQPESLGRFSNLDKCFLESRFLNFVLGLEDQLETAETLEKSNVSGSPSASRFAENFGTPRKLDIVHLHHRCGCFRNNQQLFCTPGQHNIAEPNEVKRKGSRSSCLPETPRSSCQCITILLSILYTSPPSLLRHYSIETGLSVVSLLEDEILFKLSSLTLFPLSLIRLLVLEGRVNMPSVLVLPVHLLRQLEYLEVAFEEARKYEGKVVLGDRPVH